MVELVFHSIRERIPEHGKNIAYMEVGPVLDNGIFIPGLYQDIVRYFWSSGYEVDDRFYDPDNPTPPTHKFKLHYKFGDITGSMSEGLHPRHKGCDVIWNYESVVANVLTKGMRLPR